MYKLLKNSFVSLVDVKFLSRNGSRQREYGLRAQGRSDMRCAERLMKVCIAVDER